MPEGIPWEAACCSGGKTRREVSQMVPLKIPRGEHHWMSWAAGFHPPQEQTGQHNRTGMIIPFSSSVPPMFQGRVQEIILLWNLSSDIFKYYKI